MDSLILADNVRRKVLKLTNKSHASHIGSNFSEIDILAVLYSDVLNYVADNPNWDDRDRFILSKGHGGLAVYSTLSECGIISNELLSEYYTDGSIMSGHVSAKGIPGVEFSTGSFGHEACVAAGMAYYAKVKKKPYNVYSLIGDGENEEGSIWEMAIFASKHHLDNFTLILDNNGLQCMDTIKNVTGIERFEEMWEAFGWTVESVNNGHDHAKLLEAFRSGSNGKPKIIIAHTIKGKGVSFMENEILWHFRDPQGEDYIKALRELENIG